MFVTDQTFLCICQNNMHLCYFTFSRKENEFNLGDAKLRKVAKFFEIAKLRNVKENVLQFSQHFAPYAFERIELENESRYLP